MRVNGEYVSVSDAIWKALSAAGVDLCFLDLDIRSMIGRIDPYLESLEKRIESLENGKEVRA